MKNHKKTVRIVKVFMLLVMFFVFVEVTREMFHRIKPLDADAHMERIRSRIIAKQEAVNAMLDVIPQYSEDGEWSREEVVKVHNKLLFASVLYDNWDFASERVRVSYCRHEEHAFYYPAYNLFFADPYFESSMEDTGYGGVCGKAHGP